MDSEDLKNIASAAFPQPFERPKEWSLDQFNAHIDERIDRRVSKLINVVVIAGLATVSSVIVSAWHVTNELRDAVRLADESDKRLDERALWMQRQENHDREQDRVLQRLDPTYFPPGFQELRS